MLSNRITSCFFNWLFFSGVVQKTTSKITYLWRFQRIQICLLCFCSRQLKGFVSPSKTNTGPTPCSAYNSWKDLGKRVATGGKLVHRPNVSQSFASREGHSLESIKSINMIPKQSMYGIFTYMYNKHMPNVGKYTLHGWYGIQFWANDPIYYYS